MAMPEEEENFIRIFKLVHGVAQKAVRDKFDKYFPPVSLATKLKQQEPTLKGLHTNKRLTATQMTLLFPTTGVTSSSTYDVTLMICLIRNLSPIRHPVTGFDVLPLGTDTSEGADLARVKYYRNKIAHSDIDRLSATEFTTAWNDLEQALVRLGGSSVKNMCDDIKQAVLSHDILLEVHQDISQFREEFKLQLEQINLNVADLAVKITAVRTDLDEKITAVRTDLDEKITAVRTDLDEKITAVQTRQQETKEYSCNDKEDKSIPSNIRDQIKKRIALWEENDNKFVTTLASKHVLQSVKTNSCVTVTGNSGSGKSAIVRHVALTLQREGYRVIPIDVPTELKKYYQPEIQTVFIIDDMCGNFTVNQQLIESWKQMLDTVKLITEDKSCKVIISCRLQIYKDPSFYLLKPFKMFECNIKSETICLSPTERKAIAQLYLGTHATEIDEVIHLYDFFPLLCYLYDENKHHDVKEFFENPFVVYEQELNNLFIHGDEGKYKICALALCVMFNNKLKEEYFTGKKDPHIQTVIEETCEALELSRTTPKLKLKTYLDTLVGTFICTQEGLYRTMHDKVFDFLTFYFGTKIVKCIIQNSDSEIIYERFRWITGDKKCKADFTVKLPDDCLELYIDRLISDSLKGNVLYVFANSNLDCPAFRSRFLSRVSELDRSEQEKLVNITDNTIIDDFELRCTALHVVTYFGYIDLIQWLLERGADAGATTINGESPLYIACQEGRLEVVCKLLERNNIDPNLCDKDGWTPLHIACYKGHLEVVCKLLECNNVDPNICDKDGRSPLYIACYKGHLEVVCKLLECNNVDPNLCQQDGRSPLFIASHKGHLEVVCELLEYSNVDPNLCQMDGRSPLYIACQEGRLEVVCKLLERNNIDPNLCDKDGRSPLYIACQEGRLEVVCKLLECNNVDPNICDKDGRSPLYIACYKGRLEVVCKLLERNNVDPNLCQQDGRSPLFIACQEGHLEVVCELLECNNVDPNLCHKDGWTPLYIACQEGRLEVVCKLLECNNVDPNLCHRDGRSPLYIACQEGRLEVVCKLLERNNVDFNLCDKDGWTPLHIACYNGHLEVVCKLLECNNVDFNHCLKDGWTPLHIACYKGHLEVVCKLLECNNVDPNLCHRDGRSPLYIACQEGRLEVVCKLLERNNVDPNLCYKDGWTPLYIACQEGRLEVVCKLLECNNVDPNLCHRDGRSPLYIACQEGRLEVVCKLLERNNVDFNLCDKDGWTPLHIACYNGHLEVVCKLLECNNVDPNLCRKDGISPLYASCQKGHLEVVCKLLECNNVDPNLCQQDGVSPLFIACQEGHLEVVCKLLECNNVDPNLCDRDGWSPLHIACYKGRLGLACKLLEFKADSSLRTNTDMLSVDIARETGYTEIVSVLKQVL